jgi:hypothetical protein
MNKQAIYCQIYKENTRGDKVVIWAYSFSFWKKKSQFSNQLAFNYLVL